MSCTTIILKRKLNCNDHTCGLILILMCYIESILVAILRMKVSKVFRKLWSSLQLIENSSNVIIGILCPIGTNKLLVERFLTHATTTSLGSNLICSDKTNFITRTSQTRLIVEKGVINLTNQEARCICHIEIPTNNLIIYGWYFGTWVIYIILIKFISGKRTFAFFTFS